MLEKAIRDSFPLSRMLPVSGLSYWGEIRKRVWRPLLCCRAQKRDPERFYVDKSGARLARTTAGRGHRWDATGSGPVSVSATGKKLMTRASGWRDPSAGGRVAPWFEYHAI
jgi:hypothetical protein